MIALDTVVAVERASGSPLTYQSPRIRDARRAGGATAMSTGHDPISVAGAVQHAVAALARGGLVVVIDEADRENEGDLSRRRAR